MKKCIALALSMIIILTMVGCDTQRHSGSVSDGENFSAMVTDDELVLDLRKDTESDIWVCRGKSDLLEIVSSEEHDDFVEFHFISLADGSDTIAINHVKDDGSEETYNLTVKISKQGKDRLYINSVSFVKAG